jgi:hypothetical protein
MSGPKDWNVHDLLDEVYRLTEPLKDDTKSDTKDDTVEKLRTNLRKLSKTGNDAKGTSIVERFLKFLDNAQ